jgi:hypothetical protein
MIHTCRLPLAVSSAAGIGFRGSLARSIARMLVLTIVLAALGVGVFFTGTRPLLAEDAVALRYDWQEDFQYHCQFTLTASIAGDSETFRGMTVLQRLPDQAAESESEQSPEESSGTAFAVHSDGLLVTCAHVVRGATKIEAHFGQQVYTAKIIAYDADVDLALLKIDAQDIPCLPFCDSDQVELAEEIRVVGYPLSTVLGESVKISRGTISGLIKRDDENRFQIDARVNPGNSGGPLVDEQGRVVGVASELLTSEDIDSIGFAIPGNEVLRMLRGEDRAIEPTGDGETLSGPLLAKQVAPAVGLLKVQTGPGGFATGERQRLLFTSFWHTGSLRSSSRSSDSGTLLLDSLGEVIANSSEQLLPFLFQSPGTLGIEHLPGDKRSKWKSVRFVALQMAAKVAADPDEFSPPRAPYMPPVSPLYRSPYDRYRLNPPQGRSPRVQVVRVVPAIEEIHYRRLPETAEGIVKIEKQYKLSAVAKEGGDGPSLELTTEGTLEWDAEIGCFKNAKLEGQLILDQQDVRVRIPVSLSYEFSKQKPDKQKSADPPAVVSSSAGGSQVAPESKPSVRKIEPLKSPATTSTIETAPAATGLSKFNPQD